MILASLKIIIDTFIQGSLFFPHLGYLPDITMEQFQELQTTSNSAFDGSDGTFGAYKPWANYFNFTGEANRPNTRYNQLHAFQIYKNPAMYENMMIMFLYLQIMHSETTKFICVSFSFLYICL
jgi:hypothetical protein